MPVLPLIAGAGWLAAVTAAESALSGWTFRLVALPLLGLAVTAASHPAPAMSGRTGIVTRMSSQKTRVQ